MYYFLTTVKELLIGKFMGCFVVTMLIECLGFTLGRAGQTKPPPPGSPKFDAAKGPAARAAWSTASKSFCGGEGSPPSMLWDRFIGPEVVGAHPVRAKEPMPCPPCAYARVCHACTRAFVPRWRNPHTSASDHDVF